jgi:hypothetical protein
MNVERIAHGAEAEVVQELNVLLVADRQVEDVPDDARADVVLDGDVAGRIDGDALVEAVVNAVGIDGERLGDPSGRIRLAG